MQIFDFGGGHALSGTPSQALPRQLPRRGSQAVSLDTKVLGLMRKLPGVLLALPLGELAKRNKNSRFFLVVFDGCVLCGIQQTDMLTFY